MAKSAEKSLLGVSQLARREAVMVRRSFLTGRQSVSDFVVATVQQAAKAIVHEREMLPLNESQSRAFVEALLNPPAANEAL